MTLVFRIAMTSAVSRQGLPRYFHLLTNYSSRRKHGYKPPQRSESQLLGNLTYGPQHTHFLIEGARSDI